MAEFELDEDIVEEIVRGFGFAGVDPHIASLTERIKSAHVVACEPIRPIIFDVDHLLPAADAPTLVFGPPGSLKSWIAIELADAIVQGAPFLGFQTRRREKALYLNVDAGADTFENRFRMRERRAAEGFDFLTLSAPEFRLDVLRAVLDSYRSAFVVIDCLSAIYDPKISVDPAYAMRSFVDELRGIFAEADCGGIVIDHPHRPREGEKVGDYYGSGQKEATFRSMWLVAPVESDDPNAPPRTRISCRKLSEGPKFAPIDVEFDFGERVVVRRANVIELPTRASIVDDKVRAWVRTQKTAFSRRQIEQQVRGRSVSATRESFDRLVSAGEIVATGQKRGGGDLFRYQEMPGASACPTHSDALVAPSSVSDEVGASVPPPPRRGGESGRTHPDAAAGASRPDGSQ